MLTLLVPPDIASSTALQNGFLGFDVLLSQILAFASLLASSDFLWFWVRLPNHEELFGESLELFWNQPFMSPEHQLFLNENRGFPVSPILFWNVWWDEAEDQRVTEMQFAIEPRLYPGR